MPPGNSFVDISPGVDSTRTISLLDRKKTCLVVVILHRKLSQKYNNSSYTVMHT